MVVKYAFKCMCFIALAVYGMMSMNIMNWIWKHYKPRTEYEIKVFSDRELDKFDVHQIDMLQESVELGDDYGFDTNKIMVKDNKIRGKINFAPNHGFFAKGSESYDSQYEHFVHVGNISVFSAYYDNRANLDHPLVRIMGLTSTESKDSLVCGFLESVMGPWILAEKYELCENHGKSYGGYMFNCKIPEHVKIIPKKVYLHSLSTISNRRPNINTSVVLNITNFKQKLKHLEKYRKPNDIGVENRNTKAIHVETDNKNTNNNREENVSNETQHRDPSLKYDSDENVRIGVCVSPMYGKINLSNLIQFLELLKLQGVHHMIVYKMTISKSVQVLFDYYQSKGDITVVNWRLPSFVQINQIWYNGQILMIQDCLYKMMGNFDYVAFLDLDETIIPRLDFEWSKLIQRLQKQSNFEYPKDEIVGFSFRSAFFDPNKQTANSQKLSFLKTLQRNEILSTRRTKVIVKPEFVVEMGIHHVSNSINSNHNVTVHEVSPDVGLIHHFKKCTTQLDPHMECEISTEDTSILKYEKPLTLNYNMVLRQNIKYFKNLS